MTEEMSWFEIPMTFSLEEYTPIEPQLLQLGIHFRRRTKKKFNPQMKTTEYTYTIYVAEEHAKAAAIFFRNYLDIEDPATSEPFSGTCPACGGRVEGAWKCPECEINFHSGFDEDHPMVAFIRQFGAFEDR